MSGSRGTRFSSRINCNAHEVLAALGCPALVLLVPQDVQKEKIEADLEKIRDLYRDNGTFMPWRKSRRSRWWTPSTAGHSSFTAGAGANGWTSPFRWKKVTSTGSAVLLFGGTNSSSRRCSPRPAAQARRSLLARQSPQGYRELHQTLRRMGLHQFHSLAGYRA